MPVNELPYVPDQPAPPTLAQLARRFIVLPDIEHEERHGADLFKGEWRWRACILNGVHGNLCIWIRAGFNTNPEINKRDERQQRAILECQWDERKKFCREAVALYLTKPWYPPIFTGLGQHVCASLHQFLGACAIVDEGFDLNGSAFTAKDPRWNYYVPLSERIARIVQGSC